MEPNSGIKGNRADFRYSVAMREPFHSIYSHGFIRAAVCIPSLRVADPRLTWADAGAGAAGIRSQRGGGAVPGVGDLGLLERGFVPPGRPAGGRPKPLSRSS